MEFRKVLNVFFNSIFAKIKNLSINIFNFFVNLFLKIKKWMGIDGLLNFETSFIIVCILSLLFSEITSAILALIIISIKTYYDTSNEHYDELHDFICCISGILFGMFIIGYHGIILIL